MKKITRNIATLMLLTVAGTTVATAQVVEQKVGDNNLIMNQNAVLEIESTNRGLLLPRLELTATDSFAPLTAHVEGMTVYNTATAGTGATAVTPGYYYNDGTQWVRVATGADAKTEPWFVQNTANEATANDDNIYQEGKVAIGFTSSDAVSDKQLEVKGDFKTNTEVAGRQVGFETNYAGSGISMWYNSDDIDNPTDVGAIQLHQNSVHLVAQSPTNIGATQIAPGMVEYRAGNWGTTDGVSIHHLDKDQIFLSSGSGAANEDLTNLYVRKGEGILFSHTDENTDLEGQYRFPRNAGTVGQVLAVDTYAAAAEYSELSWQNVNDLVDVTEPWKIQNTTNDATANTDDIYQQGKVAIGFTDADAVSNKQFEVKGDIKSVTNTAGTYSVFETNNTDFGVPFNIMLSADNPDVLAATAYGAVSTSLNTSTLNASGANGDASIGVDSGFGGISSRAEMRTGKADNTVTNAVIVGSNGETEVVEKIYLRSEDTTAGTATRLLVDKADGVTFKHGTIGSPSGNYTFPQNNGTAGQVLVTDGAAPTLMTGAQLSWADASDLVDINEPWRVQGTTNEATANTENIFQLGSVAIGANTIPSITTGSGTVNPMLHVAGDVSTTGKFYTTSSVYADYVFEKYFDGTSEINDEYEFKSLDYIKAFIEENKHLPGVTKIEDLLKGENGYMFDMTELSIQQLEKIEELFLHVIEQNEQIIELEKQVEDNNNRLDALEKLLLDNSK